MLRASRAEEVFRDRVISPLSRLCVDNGIGGAAISLAAILAATAAGVLFIFEPALGGALYLLSGLLDTLDDSVSRQREGGTRAGAFLDSLLDRYAELFVLLGILGFYSRTGGLSPVLVYVLFLGGFGSWMVSYAQARAEGLGSSCSHGFFERPERVVLLGAAAAVSPIVDALEILPGFLSTRPTLGVGLVVLAVGVNVTALTRLVRGFRTLLREDQHARARLVVTEYLESSFPSCTVSREWDASCRALVFRVTLPSKTKTMLLEISTEAIEAPYLEPWPERLARCDVPGALRRHPRMRVTPSGLEPLPWRQLDPAEDPVDEQLRESFPASDPAPHSSVS